MDFNSVAKVLRAWGGEALGQRLQEYRHLLQCWEAVVGPGVARQTRPLGIDDRRVLSVATTSATLSNDLTMRRRQILAKLNGLLSPPVVDIKFSSLRCQETQPNNPPPRVVDQKTLWRQHPSRIDQMRRTESEDGSSPPSAQAAFQQWAAGLQQLGGSLPLCPACESPTPPGELDRWSVCYLCATKTWANSLISPAPSDLSE